MKCPSCKERTIHVEDGDGYCQDIRECDSCGTMWTFRDGKLTIIFTQ